MFPPIHDPHVELIRKECLARHAIASELERQAAERLIKLLDDCQPPALLT